MKKTIFLLLLIASISQTTAQTLTGHLSQHAGQTIALMGFDYYKGYELAKTTADSLGNFVLNYPKTYTGMGVLKTQDNSSLILLLTENNIELQGIHLNDIERLQFVNSLQNLQFFNFATQNIDNQQALQAWNYLQPLYEKTSLKQYKNVLKNIKKELIRIENADSKAIEKIEKNGYLHWFLPKQLLVNAMPQSAKSYTKRIPQNIQQFRTTNFNHPNFKTSGLFKELIEGHYMLLENMGQPTDSINVQMNASTNYLINNLKANDSLLNTVSKELLSYFEKRSLYPAASYLSNKILADSQCMLNNKLANTMEKYRSLKVGNTAPDIQLSNGKLSDIKKPVLLVFGASWCPHCKDEAIELLKYYDAWKTSKQVEVVYISIDTDEAAYKTAYQNAPWQQFCDYKGWETQAAKDYFVNATPTYILLDKDLKILEHPSSLGQVDAWVNYRL